MTTGEGEFAEAGAETEDVPVGDAELAGLVLVVGFGVLVGFGVVVGGDVEGAGEAEDGVVVGVTTTVAAGGGLKSR